MILITGATGTNGREIVTRLAEDGIPVRALVRDPEKAAALFPETAELSRGDLGDPASIEAALDGVDVAFLLTAVDPRQTEWQTNFIDAANRTGVRHVVKFSGMGASPATASVLLRMHAETDELLRRSGVGYTLLQPNSFMQNVLWMAGSIASQGVFYQPMGEAKQSLVDVRDIADVAVKVLMNPTPHAGQTYVLTGPEALTFHDVAARLSAALGKPVKYVPVPASAAVQGMLQAGMPRWNAESVGELMDYFATGAAAGVTDTVTRVLGRPARSFDQFARDFKGAFAGTQSGA